MRTNVFLFLCCAITAAWAAPTFAQTPPLAGSEWRPTEIDGIAVAADSGIFLQFAADGKVQGSGGCNRFVGSYEIEGEKIGFGPLAATRMLCPDPVNENETRFFASLERTDQFMREQLRLTLKDSEENVVVEFVQTDAD